MKYLLIAALIALVFVLIYRRIRPYIQLLKKIFGVASDILSSEPAPRKVTSPNKLTKCVGCETWVPAGRAIKVGASVYCSRDCLEALPLKKKGKLAG